MRISYTAFGVRARLTYSRLKIALHHLPVTAALTAVLATTVPAGAQTQTAAPTGLDDAQAIALLQALAKGQSAGAGALSAAQTQMLLQYLQRESRSETAAAGADLLRVEMLRAQSQGSAPAGIVQTAPQTTAGTPASTATGPSVGPRKPGTVRIGVVQPKAQMGQGNSGVNVAEPLRVIVMQYLSGPAVQVIPIAAMMPTQIDAEMKEKECDYVLFSSISQKMSGGGFGMMQKAMPYASMIPMVGAVGGMATMVAGSAAGAAMSGAAGLSGSVKAKSEVTYDYRLIAPGSSTPVLANSVKAKAKRDGDDIVTPLIEQAAGAILAQVAKKT